MKVRAVFSDEQPSYRYFPLGNGKADVFIYKFIEEVTDEEGTSFIYDMNEFKVDIEEISEEVIAENPLDWIDYDSTIPNIPIEERISAMEDAVMELSEVIFNG